MDNKLPIKGAWQSRSRDFFKFWEMIDNIWEMVQDRDIVTVEDKEQIIYGLSNGTISKDLE